VLLLFEWRAWLDLLILFTLIRKGSIAAYNSTGWLISVEKNLTNEGVICQEPSSLSGFGDGTLLGDLLLGSIFEHSCLRYCVLSKPN